MGHWMLTVQGQQPILTHYCEAARPNDKYDVLRQDIGGGYVRCERCEEKYLPDEAAGNPRYIFRLKRAEEYPAAV